MKIIALDRNNQPISDYFTVNSTGVHAQEWEKLQLTIPAIPNAVWLHVILHASAGGRNGQIVFDDFSIN